MYLLYHPMTAFFSRHGVVGICIQYCSYVSHVVWVLLLLDICYAFALYYGLPYCERHRDVQLNVFSVFLFCQLPGFLVVEYVDDKTD